MRKPKKQKKPLNDLSRSLTPFDPNRTLIGVIELGKESWLVAGIVPGVERQPLKKLPADENGLLKLLPTANARRSLANKPPSSTASRRPWRDWASAPYKRTQVRWSSGNH